MRLPVRRLAPATLSAFLLLGVTGPALAAGSDQPGEHAAPAAQAPVADAEALLAQTQNLDDLNEVLKPTTKLLHAVLKADNGRLTPQESTQHAVAVKEAIAKAGATEATILPAPASAKASPEPGLAADARTALQKSVDALLESSAAGDTAQVQSAANDVMTNLVNVAAATLADGGMPAPDMAGLPTLSGLPTAQQQPTSQPPTSKLPTASEQQTPRLPQAQQPASQQEPSQQDAARQETSQQVAPELPAQNPPTQDLSTS